MHKEENAVSAKTVWSVYPGQQFTERHRSSTWPAYCTGPLVEGSSATMATVFSEQRGTELCSQTWTNSALWQASRTGHDTGVLQHVPYTEPPHPPWSHASYVRSWNTHLAHRCCFYPVPPSTNMIGKLSFSITSFYHFQDKFKKTMFIQWRWTQGLYRSGRPNLP